METLKQLAHDKNIRDARKLYQFAVSRGIPVTTKLANEALKDSVARQVLAPPPRYQGHFAASRPGNQVQADLMDFNKNTSKSNENRYAVVAVDAFTRKAAIEPLKTKNSDAVRGAMRNILKDLDIDDPDKTLIRTDRGKEFVTLSKDSNIHQTKDLKDSNGIAIVDRAIQSIKRDLASEVGKSKETKWAEVAEKVVKDHNSKPIA